MREQKFRGNVFVANLPKGYTDEDLAKAFDPFGIVVGAFLARDSVTGAPKLWAIRFIEEEERSSRRWYGGAIGRVTFDGNINTGLTLRTMRMKDGIAEIRAGATLLYDSDPEAEEAECRLKAAALLGAIRGPGSNSSCDKHHAP